MNSVGGARVLAAAGILVVMCLAHPVWAGPTECQDALTEYKSAREDISTALRSYASCLSNDDGHDDCASEFSTLQSAQSDFETAVSNYQSECN